MYGIGHHVLERAVSQIGSKGPNALQTYTLPRLDKSRLLDIEDYLMFHGYQYSRIEDNIDGEHRHASMAVFVAINLATADIDILYDSDWLTYKLKIRFIGFARRKKLKFTYSAQSESSLLE
ncbi:probable chromatin-remodeling complex ATPase chain [Lotus japonicus]|uniref:probable chromatin-remodeling complex ATPase chain n=1 Tax=Lotus japonicus TaxID=34305 RepID=UPI00258EB72A|nr:probable chromatin-remodeling complex ATPase chain [Lotus japonicus]